MSNTYELRMSIADIMAKIIEQVVDCDENSEELKKERRKKCEKLATAILDSMGFEALIGPTKDNKILGYPIVPNKEG